MPNADDILWFKTQFAHGIEKAVQATPFSLDMLTAIACQESGEIWPVLRKRNLGVERILELCVGDTLDGDRNRRAFPTSRAALITSPGGAEMFDIARSALVAMAAYIPGYRSVAKNPDKFCHGFGIFQYDLQHFVLDPGFFLRREYADFNASLGKCVAELHAAMKRIKWQAKTRLTDYEMACVAIAYNTGGFKPGRGLKQCHFNGAKYYGEAFFDYLRLAHTVVRQGAGFVRVAVPAGRAIIAPPTPVDAGGPFFRVDTREALLNVRSEPKIDPAKRNANVIARLPEGHIVRAASGRKVNNFLEIETSLAGAHYRGYASGAFLKRVPGATEVPVITPAPAPPRTGIIAVHMPRKPGVRTTRTQPAGAHSLNEAGQPQRSGATPDRLRDELAEIIDWLAVDRAAHLRYQPRNRQTFCNIYAHDYCHLAGAYLPRVWWTSIAVAAMLQGQSVQPLYGRTIEELRANDLFRWLRDFGLLFGWRQTGDLSGLQLEVNQGALGLIVARRKVDGLSGHIVPVVPEAGTLRARRNATGTVIAPLQSQAGTVNFRYGTGKLNWWLGEQFSDSAFWIHA